METQTKYSKCVFLVVFKSYYVVWKPGHAWEEIYIHIRLNRTMQYGNVDPPDAEKKEEYSLNRTMQYGN